MKSSDVVDLPALQHRSFRRPRQVPNLLDSQFIQNDMPDSHVLIGKVDQHSVTAPYGKIRVSNFGW